MLNSAGVLYPLENPYGIIKLQISHKFGSIKLFQKRCPELKKNADQSVIKFVGEFFFKNWFNSCAINLLKKFCFIDVFIKVLTN